MTQASSSDPQRVKSPIESRTFTFFQRDSSFSWQVLRIMSEFVDGFEFVSQLERPVTIFGSARLGEGDPDYERARALGHRLAEAGYTVVTGGGPGIMEAGNRGATEAGGVSVGLNIELPMEQRLNAYVRQGMGFHYFFSRKFMLDYSALAYVYMPGGFGTLDELFTVLTLIQTRKSDADVPVILFGTAFWAPLIAWIKATVLPRGLIHASDMTLFHVTDDIDEVLRLIATAGDREYGGG